MLYSYTITAHKDKDETEAERTVLPLEWGILHHVGIYIPAGHAGLAHLRIRRALNQVIPRNVEGTIHGDAQYITFDEFLYLKEPPRQFEAYVWNLDEFHDHDFIVHLSILPPIAFPQLGPGWEDTIPILTDQQTPTPEE